MRISNAMDRYDTARRRQTRPGRSTLGYWLPLVVTVTIATAGLAAWIWSERQHDNDGDDDDNDRDDDAEDDTYDHPLDYPEDIPNTREQVPDSGDEGFLSRVTGRDLSPQPPAFSDNEHWNEEAETRRSQRHNPSSQPTKKPKRTVVVVLNGEEQDGAPLHDAEHAVSPVKSGCHHLLANTS
jgi:hypothetical protein